MSKEEYSVELTLDLAKATTTLVQYLSVLRSAIRLSRKLGLPDEVNQAMRLIQKMITILYMLRTAYLAVLAARAAAGDPLAIAQAGVAIAGVIITSAECASTYG